MIEAGSVDVRKVTEERRGDVPLFVHPEWTRWNWLVQGITGRDAGNFASFGEQTSDTVQTRWRTLRQRTGTRRSVIGRQVHGASVLSHDTFADGMLFANDADGHLTRVVGTLLAVSVADCVPVFIVDERSRMVATLHAGWRGIAAGILARGLKCMGGFIANTWVHLGPAICGDCYEVGPEVHAALGLAEPAGNSTVDLRSVLARQAVEMGINSAQITTSSYCTKCNDAPFFSHRAGHSERQVGIIALTAAHG